MIAATVIEHGGLGRGVGSDLLGMLERTPILPVRRDPSRPKRVVARAIG